MISRIMQIALLGLNLAAQAGVPPAPDTTPPSFDQTQIIGAKVQAAGPNIEGWEQQLVGQAANYNAYTKKLDDTSLVAKYLKTCKGPDNKQTFQCDFTANNSGAELLANTLISPKAYTDPDQRKAAMSFVNNLTNMTPVPYPGDDVVFKDPQRKENGLTTDGITYFAKMFKQLPLLSVTQNSLLSIFADRDRLPGLSTGLPSTVGVNGAASLIEVLDYEATRRYTNTGWFQSMNTSSDSATLHEIAYMMAFQNYLMVKSYEQNSRIEMLLAAQVSAMNNMSGMLNQTGDSKSAGQSLEKYQ